MKKAIYIPEDYTEVMSNAYGEIRYQVHASGKIYARGYHTKAGKITSKAKWHYSFRNAANFNTYATEWLMGLQKAHALKEEEKAQRKAARSQLASSVKVGDIFVSSWGYEQTNVDFYQVIKKSGSSITVREIDSRMADRSSGNGMAGYCLPIKDSFLEKAEPMKKILSGSGFKVSSYSSAYLWDGKEKYVSWYA